MRTKDLKKGLVVYHVVDRYVRGTVLAVKSGKILVSWQPICSCGRMRMGEPFREYESVKELRKTRKKR